MDQVKINLNSNLKKNCIFTKLIVYFKLQKGYLKQKNHRPIGPTIKKKNYVQPLHLARTDE